MLILAIIVAVLAIITLGIGLFGRFGEWVREDYGSPKVFRASPNVNKALKLSGAGGLVLFFIDAGTGEIYTQDPGEAKVLRSVTGDVVGQSETEGLHVKAPWVDALTYDVRNQQVIFANPTGKEPQNANGPQITVQDREGVTANIDITVRYSIDPDAVTTIYKKYGDQSNFISKFIENDIRAGVRTIPAGYGTLELLNNRAEVEAKIATYLAERWESHGVRAESVSLQEIRYSDDVKQRFDDAQASRIKVEQARADLEATEVSAQQQVVQAQAEAEANRVLTASLTDEVLRSKYLETLAKLAKAGNLVITDGSGSQVLIQR
jgi:regulator of protease activity HflC (stomatin/prohibitin superfamily)